MPDNEAVEGLPEQAPENASARYPTRELGRLIKYYRENIKDFGKAVPTGTMRNIQRLLDAGIELTDIVLAMENYEQARKNQDPQYTLGVRSFFSEDKVRYWLDPPKQTPFKAKPTLPEIKFVPLVQPQPVVPVPAQLAFEEDDDQFTL